MAPWGLACPNYSLLGVETSLQARKVPLSAQQPIRESGAAMLIAGGSSDASSPAVMPMLRTMGFSPYQPVAAAPPQPLLSGGERDSASRQIYSSGRFLYRW
jgi:hypothetical protein